MYIDESFKVQFPTKLPYVPQFVHVNETDLKNKVLTLCSDSWLSVEDISDNGKECKHEEAGRA